MTMSNDDITDNDIKCMLDYMMTQLSISFMMSISMYNKKHSLGLEDYKQQSTLQPPSETPVSSPQEQYKKRPRSRGIHKKVREKVFKRNHYTCQICGRKYPEEHLVPNHIDHNRRNDKPSNLETTCAGCNMQEGRIYAELLRNAGPRSEVTEENRLRIAGEARNLTRKSVPNKGWRKMY